MIGRYIFRQTFQALILCLVTLVAIIWLTQVLREFDVITAQGQSLDTFLAMTILVLPAFVNVIAPVSLFIATLHTLNRLNADSELVVLSAAGVSRWRIIAPFFLLAVIVATLVGYINMSLMPKSLSVLRVLITEARADLISHIIQPGRFSTPEPGITFHIRARAPQGDLIGLLVDDRRDPEMHITYVAQRGRIIRTAEGSYLEMEQGNVLRQDTAQADRTQIVAFDRYLIDVAQLSESQKTVLYKPRERSTAFLWNPDPEDPYVKHVPGRFRSELHERLSSPLMPILLVFIALANVGFARTTREGRGYGVALAIVGATGSMMAIVGTQNLAQKHAWAIPFMYLVPLAIILLSALLAFGMLRQRWTSGLAGYGAFAASWIVERLTAASHIRVRS
ncbi:MAG: LPS export ABC transporter permease LptF [Hoeflea sp.]|nr:LPS export ABC transporter permease LptF [Hoeflea sp.]